MRRLLFLLLESRIGKKLVQLYSLNEDFIFTGLKASSKKQIFELLSEKIAPLCGLKEEKIFYGLLEREKLGSTALGNGVAIPHAKFSGLEKVLVFFARLSPAVDFEADDEQPVDLIFVILAPEKSYVEHLKALSSIARFLRDPEVLATLRHLEKKEEIYSYIKDFIEEEATFKTSERES